MLVLTKEEIIARYRALSANRKRGFPLRFFCEFAGVHIRNVNKMCLEQSQPMSELSQRKLSKAFLALETGEAGLRFDILGKKFIGWHPKNQQKPYLKRSIGLKMGENGFELQISRVNRFAAPPTPILRPKESK
jgi:hypothetical protein